MKAGPGALGLKKVESEREGTKAKRLESENPQVLETKAQTAWLRLEQRALSPKVLLVRNFRK